MLLADSRIELLRRQAYEACKPQPVLQSAIYSP